MSSKAPRSPKGDFSSSSSKNEDPNSSLEQTTAEHAEDANQSTTSGNGKIRNGSSTVSTGQIEDPDARMVHVDAQRNANPAYQAYRQAIRDGDDEAYYKAIRDGALDTGVKDDVEEATWPHVEPYVAPGEVGEMPDNDEDYGPHSIP